MGNSNSASVELTQPQQNWGPSTYPRENHKRKQQQHKVNGLSPENKVLPDMVAGARLRQTRLGAILQSGGTITGRKKELSHTPTSPTPEVDRGRYPIRSTPLPINIHPNPHAEPNVREGAYQPARRRLSNVFEVAERERDRTRPSVKKFDSEPDLREPEIPMMNHNIHNHRVISEPPAKSRIKARKNKRAPPPPGNDRAKSLPRDLNECVGSKESEPYSLPDLSKSIVKVQHWQEKQVDAVDEDSQKKGPFRKLRLFKTKSDGKKNRGEEGSDLSSRRSAPPGSYEWDLYRRVNSQERHDVMMMRGYPPEPGIQGRMPWNVKKNAAWGRAKSVDCIQAQLQDKYDEKQRRLHQGKSLECISTRVQERPHSRCGSDINGARSPDRHSTGVPYISVDSKRRVREVKRGKEGNSRGRLDETLSSGGSSGRRSSRLDGYKDSVFVNGTTGSHHSDKVLSRSHSNDRTDIMDAAMIKRQHSQLAQSPSAKVLPPPDFASEIKAAVQRRLSQRLSGESTGQVQESKNRNEVYRSASKIEKSTPTKQFYFGMEENIERKNENNLTKHGARVMINGDSVEYKRSSDINNRDRSMSRESHLERLNRSQSCSRDRLEPEGDKEFYDSKQRQRSPSKRMSNSDVENIIVNKRDSMGPVFDSHNSVQETPKQDKRKLSREVDKFASVIKQKQKKLVERAATERDELIGSQEEFSSNHVGSSSSSDGELGVLMHLRPTLPRKQMEIPRFSPTAAWRAITYRASESPLGSNPSSNSSEEPEGDIFEARIRLSSRPVAPRRISNEKSGDSGISGDAGSPGPLQDFDLTTSDKMKRSELSMRPLAVSSPVPPFSADSSMNRSKHWTPEQDLEEESMGEGSLEHSPISSPERFASGVTTPPKLTSRTHMFMGRQITIPLENSQESSPKDYIEDRKVKPKGRKGKAPGEESAPTPNTFNSLRKLKRTMSNALGSRRGKSPDERHSLDENWSLSRSVPNSLNKSEEPFELPVRARTWSVDKLRDTVEGNKANEKYYQEAHYANTGISLHQVRPAGFNRLFGTNRHIMYLPEYNSVKLNMANGESKTFFGDLLPEQKFSNMKEPEALYSNVNVPRGEIYRAWESAPPPPPTSPPISNNFKNDTPKKKGKKFTFNSTVRQQERKRLEQQLNRESEEKERQRRKEMELMNRVEKEFQQKRSREKANIRQQLRLMQMQNQAADFHTSPLNSPHISDRSQRRMQSPPPDLGRHSEFVQTEHHLQERTIERTIRNSEEETRREYANLPSHVQQEYANIEAIRKHHKPGYLITRRPSTKNPNSDDPPPPPTSPPPPVTPEEYLPAPVPFGRLSSSSSQPDNDSSDTNGTSRLDSPSSRKESNGLLHGFTKWMKGKSKGSPKSSSPTESRSLSPTRQEPDGAAEPDQKKGEDFRREIIAASKTRAGEVSPILGSSQIHHEAPETSRSPERKKSIYKHLSEVAENEEKLRKGHSPSQNRWSGDKEKARSNKTGHNIPLTQELSEFKEERREYKDYRGRIEEHRVEYRHHRHSDSSSEGKHPNGPTSECAKSPDNYRLGFALGSSHPSDSDHQERRDIWSRSSQSRSGSADTGTPQPQVTSGRFGMGSVQPFNPKPGYRPVSFSPRTAPVS